MTKTRGFLFAAGISLAMAFTYSCSSPDDGEEDTKKGGGSSSSGGGGGGSSSSDGNGGGGSSSSVVVNPLSLDGVWLNSGGRYVTITSANGVPTGLTTQISDTRSTRVELCVGNGKINVGDGHFRNFEPIEDLKWKVDFWDFMWQASPNSCDMTWRSITITMSADGQRLTTTTNIGDDKIWTRISYGGGSSSSVGGGNSSPSGGGDGNTFTDSRDGKTYSTVTIGGVKWMAENLKYNATGSKCLGEGRPLYYTIGDGEEEEDIEIEEPDIQELCDVYGRLYDWNTARANTTCPSGWHLPTNNDWDILFKYVDSQHGGIDGDDGEGGYDSEKAGKYLKSDVGWDEYLSGHGDPMDGNGLDTYSFTALAGGSGIEAGYYGDVYFSAGYYRMTRRGYWWSADQSSNTEAYYRTMFYNYDYAFWISERKSALFSVRCIQN